MMSHVSLSKGPLGSMRLLPCVDQGAEVFSLGSVFEVGASSRVWWFE